MDAYFLPIILTALFCGMGISLLGVFIVGMRMPFIGSCLSHAAMVGAVAAALVNQNPIIGAVLLSTAASGWAAFLPAHQNRLDANTGQAVLLAFLMGLVFLGVGIEQNRRSEMLALLWGNVLFAGWDTAALSGLLFGLLILFLTAFDGEMKAILFSRSLAAATRPYSTLIYFLFLCLTGLMISVTLQTVGGLLLFSLLVCPAAAAYLLGRGYRAVVFLAMLFGVLSAGFGLVISYFLRLPTGACIVLVGTLFFLLAAGLKMLFHIRECGNECCIEHKAG
ncbi:MAG: metal ABC transporter permease [Anaerohalosphaeraceae bacterium]